MAVTGIAVYLVALVAASLTLSRVGTKVSFQIERLETVTPPSSAAGTTR